MRILKMFRFSKRPLVAIDIGSYSVKLSQLKQIKNTFELENFAVLPIKPTAISDGLIKDSDEVVDVLTQLIKVEDVKTRFAVTSVAGEAVIIKRMIFPVIGPKELKERILEEAEQHIPFDIENVNINFQIVRYPGDPSRRVPITDKSLAKISNQEPDVNRIEVLLVAVPQEIINNRVEVLIKAGLKPIVMDLDIFAMMNAIGLSTDLKQFDTIILADLGNSFTHIHLIDKGFSYFAKDFRIGGQKCTEKLQSRFELAFEQADALKRGQLQEKVDEKAVVDIIVESFDPILNQIKSAIEVFEKNTSRKVEHAILSGGGALINGVQPFFQNHLKIPIQIYNPMKFIKYDRRKFDSQCISNFAPLATVSLGLAMRQFDHQRN